MNGASQLSSAAGKLSVASAIRDWIRNQAEVKTDVSGVWTSPERMRFRSAFLATGDFLVVDVSYHLEQPVSATLRPEQFRSFGSRRFHTKAPPNWELQAINYLARAERVFHLIEDLEGKSSKHRVEVRWHDMGGTAWGCAPAGGNAYIMMPFSGLRGSFNYYESPWALSHEMLHTFGYGHGDKMNRMTALVDRRFDHYRWYMADHPQQDPETAFIGFRVATRMAPGIVNLATASKKSKEASEAKAKGGDGPQKKKKKEK